MITTAVILAAGFGSRLNDKTKLRPKGFLEVEGRSLITRSIELLLSAGIKHIYIGTGHLSGFFDELIEIYPQITTIRSDKFETTSSMYTLYNMRAEISDDFLLLESDLLYGPDALAHLLTDPRKDIVLASGKTNSNDEVYIEADENQDLVAMSKVKENLKSIHSELVGISKVSHSRYQHMCELFEGQENPKIDYEYIMSSSSRTKPFPVKKVDDLVWCEIDDESHLNRALNLILPKLKANQMKVKRNVLLNPGPATTTDTVKLAQVVPDICPREKEFGDVMEYISHELTTIVGSAEEYATVIFGGSGTAAVESVLTSVVPHDKAVLIINNGAYGKRMCDIASRYRMSFIEFKNSPIEPIDLEKLESVIESNIKNLSHLAFVHNETTTGILTDLDLVGAIAKKYDLEVIVDAMSSYAALPIDMKKSHINYLAASSNKNIQGMAGVSFVISDKKSLDKLKNVEPRTYYLSLYEQYTGFLKTHQMRFTPPVQTLYALKQAIVEVKAEGIENRYKRYSQAWEVLIQGTKDLGLKILVDEKHHSRIITSIFIPENVNFDHMHDYFYERGFTIYPGKVNEFNTFRIANIGEINSDDMSNFLGLLKTYLTL